MVIDIGQLCIEKCLQARFFRCYFTVQVGQRCLYSPKIRHEMPETYLPKSRRIGKDKGEAWIICMASIYDITLP